MTAQQRAADQNPKRPSKPRGVGGAASAIAEVPAENPYAGVDRVPFGYRVYKGQHDRVADLAAQLQEQGVKRASSAEVLQAQLHFLAPRTAERGWDLIQRWGLVLDGLEENPYVDDGGAEDEIMQLQHRVFLPMREGFKLLSEELKESGASPSVANATQLVRAHLHFETPDFDQMRDLYRRWLLLKRAPPAKR